MKKYFVLSLFALMSPFAHAAVEFDGTSEYTTESTAYEFGSESVEANFAEDGDFTNFYTFTVPSTQDVTFNFDVMDGPDGGEGTLNLAVAGPDGSVYTFGNGVGENSITYTDLAPDTYLLQVETSTLNSGSYALSSSVSPVPEPSTLALMMAGFGLVGFMSNRRRKFV